MKNASPDLQSKKSKSQSKINQVIILCGGRGTRLKPMTDDVPKALVKLHDRPIVDYILDFYKSHGFERVIFCVGYKGELIREYFMRKTVGMEIKFSDAGESAGMLERIYAVKDLADDTFFVAYGDTLIDLDMEGILKDHQKKNADVTIVTAKIQNPFGLVTYGQDGFASSFVEKPLLNYYIGSFIMNRSALNKVTPAMLGDKDGQGLVALFDILIKQKRLKVFEHKGNQITFNTETERQIAEESMGQFYTFPEKR